MQKVSSKSTSGNRVAKFYTSAIKQGIVTPGTVVLDYGCGAYTGTLYDYAGEHGFMVLGYDKYNQSYYSNKGTLVLIHHAHIIACNNVLNVLDTATMNSVCRSLASIAHMNFIPCYITVYEGDRTGKNKMSGKDRFQRNEKTANYLETLKKYFPKVEIKNKIIKCSF